MYPILNTRLFVRPLFVVCFLVMLNLPPRHAKRHNFYTNKFCAKLFYPKKCINYNKSECLTNSVKGPKDQNSDNKCQEVKLNSTMCQEMPPKTEKLQHYSFSRQNSVKLAKILPQIGFFLHNIVGTLVRFCISAPPP